MNEGLANISFAGPYYALVGLGGLIVWMLHFYFIGKRPSLFFPEKKLAKAQSFRMLLGMLGIVAWLFISFALMRPQTPAGLAKNNIEVNDIYFVIDVSRSMLATDFRPNRLEVAKNKISEFVSLRPTDRIGVIMFSEQAYTLVPLSTDLELIKQVIKEINVGFLGAGTNIGDALGLAVGRAAQSIAKNKVVILLTDGVSNVGFMTPLQAAEEAKKQGIKVYTIGIGGNQNAQIPLGRNLFGNMQYQNIPGGSIDTETLKKISEITGGKSYVAGNEKALTDVLSEIEKLEKTEIKVSGRVIYNELYFKYFCIGTALLLGVELVRKSYYREIG